MIQVSDDGKLVITPGSVPLWAAEKALLELTLEAHDGNKKAAAKALQISRSALYGKLDRLGLKEPRCSVCYGKGHEASLHDSRPPASSPAHPPSPLSPEPERSPRPGAAT